MSRVSFLAALLLAVFALPTFAEEGKSLNDMKVVNEEGKEITLGSLQGKKGLIVFQYPKADTPGCTKESCSFRDNESALKKAGAVILGVSLDDEKSHQKFIKKFSLNFPLLCDEDAKVSRLYGVYKKKNMYARLFWGIERATFVIGADGKLKKIFRKVKVDGHTEEVFEALKSA